MTHDKLLSSLTRTATPVRISDLCYSSHFVCRADYNSNSDDDNNNNNRSTTDYQPSKLCNRTAERIR